jgi:hypothetical protein
MDEQGCSVFGIPIMTAVIAIGIALIIAVL